MPGILEWLLRPRANGPARLAGGVACLVTQPVNHLVERLAIDKLHDVIVQPAFLADTEHRDDAGVMQSRNCLRLASKPADRPFRSQERGRENLEGDSTAQRLLDSLIDDAHAAVPDFANDAKITQLPESADRSLLLQQVQVRDFFFFELFHHRDGGQEFAQLFGVLGVSFHVLRDGRKLTAPVSLGKFVSQLFDRISFRIKSAHHASSFDSSVMPGMSSRMAFSRFSART